MAVMPFRFGFGAERQVDRAVGRIGTRPRRRGHDDQGGSLCPFFAFWLGHGAEFAGGAFQRSFALPQGLAGGFRHSAAGVSGGSRLWASMLFELLSTSPLFPFLPFHPAGL